MRTRAVVLGAALAALPLALGCGAPKAPDLISRTLPAREGSPHDGGQQLLDETDPDGGALVGDAGVCCPVAFALEALSGESAATLVINTTSRVDLVKDGGAWCGTACMGLGSATYFYEVSLPTSSADGGVYVDTRVNEAVDSAFGSAAPRVNLFDPGSAATCEELDAGIHATLPDAG